MDVALAAYDTVWAAAGTPHTVVPLTFDQLTALTAGPTVRVAAD
jgi:prolyl-tRNA editing enzyme YbaK/EbsC (Cys-tRNA(Pro) deacylase)